MIRAVLEAEPTHTVAPGLQWPDFFLHLSVAAALCWFPWELFPGTSSPTSIVLGHGHEIFCANSLPMSPSLSGGLLPLVLVNDTCDQTFRVQSHPLRPKLVEAMVKMDAYLNHCYQKDTGETL